MLRLIRRIQPSGHLICRCDLLKTCCFCTVPHNGRPQIMNNQNDDIGNEKEEKVVSSVPQLSITKQPLESLEEPTTCCMSGCANCVWLEYAEKLTEYYKDGGQKSIKEIDEKITDPNIKAYLLHEIRMRNKE